MSAVRRIFEHPLVRIVLAALPLAAITLAARGGDAELTSPAAKVALLLTAAAASFLAYIGYVRLVERRLVHELGGPPASAVAEAGRGFVVGAALFAATIAVLWALGACTFMRGDGWRALPYAFASAFAAAVSEELLLRAVVFRIVEERLGTWLALILSAALFGALHGFNPGSTVVSTAAIALEAGVLLAAAFVLTRRLWLPIGMHAAWNFTEGGLCGARVSGTTAHGLVTSQFAGLPLLSGGEFGPEASVVAVVLCLSAAGLFLASARSRGKFVPPRWRRAA